MDKSDKTLDNRNKGDGLLTIIGMKAAHKNVTNIVYTHYCIWHLCKGGALFVHAHQTQNFHWFRRFDSLRSLVVVRRKSARFHLFLLSMDKTHMDCGILDQVNLVADQHDRLPLLLGAGLPDEGQPIGADLAEGVVVVHRVHHAHHVRLLDLLGQVVRRLLGSCNKLLDKNITNDQKEYTVSK